MQSLVIATLALAAMTAEAFPANCIVKQQKTGEGMPCEDWNGYTRCIPSSELMPAQLGAGQKPKDLVGKQWCPTKNYDPNNANRKLNWGVCFPEGATATYTVRAACLAGAPDEGTAAPTSGATTAPEETVAPTLEQTLAPSTAAATSGNTFAPTDAPTPVSTTALPTEYESTQAPSVETTIGTTEAPSSASANTQAPSSASADTQAPSSASATTQAPSTSQTTTTTQAPSAAQTTTATQRPVVTVPPFTRVPTLGTSSAAETKSYAATGVAILLAGFAAVMA